MKRNSHDAVGGEKRLLHAIAVMDVNIDVEDASMIFQEFENGENNVVDVAETTGFALLGVMQATRPIDGNVSSAVIEFNCAS